MGALFSTNTSYRPSERLVLFPSSDEEEFQEQSSPLRSRLSKIDRCNCPSIGKMNRAEKAVLFMRTSSFGLGVKCLILGSATFASRFSPGLPIAGITAGVGFIAVSFTHIPQKLLDCLGITERLEGTPNSNLRASPNDINSTLPTDCIDF